MKILVIGKRERTIKYTLDITKLKRHEFAFIPTGSSDEGILAAGKDADIMIVDAIAKVSAYVISQMPNLRMIHSEGVAFNGIDTKAAKERGIYVCNCKGMNATAVAEQAILLMLGLLRDVCNGDRSVREGNQIKVKESYMMTGSLKELANCTIGLVGFGDIAKATAKLAGAFGAKVLYYSRHRVEREVEENYGVTYMSLNELLIQSDIVSLHVPVTPETVHYANADFLSKMKEGSYFINTGRGELVDGKALLNAIERGHIAGAGLDTIEGEPVQKENLILQALEEVERKIIYSCHIGGITGASFQRGYDMIWSDIDKIEAGQEPDHVVNK